MCFNISLFFQTGYQFGSIALADAEMGEKQRAALSGNGREGQKVTGSSSQMQSESSSLFTIYA
jgi:hypothetical protein